MESIEVGPSDLLSQYNSSLTVMAVGSLKEGAGPGAECKDGEGCLDESGGEEDALQRRPGQDHGYLDEDPGHHRQAGGGVQAPRQTEPVVLSEERGGLDASDDNAEKDSGPEI